MMGHSGADVIPEVVPAVRHGSRFRAKLSTIRPRNHEAAAPVKGRWDWAKWIGALALVGAWLLTTSPYLAAAPPAFDESLFLDVGRAIALSGLPIQTFGRPHPSFFFDHTPLLVYVAGLATLVGSDTLTIMRAVVWTTGLGVVLGTFAIVRGWVGFLAAALLAAGSPLLIAAAWILHMEEPMALTMVLAVLCLQREWLGRASVALAAGVMLKEFALLFAAVMTIYVLWRHGRVAAHRFAAPTVFSFIAWLAFAAALSAKQLGLVLQRWIDSAAWSTEGRFSGPPLEWLTVLGSWVGWIVVAFAVGAIGLAVARRMRPSPLAIACFGYVILAIIASLVLAEKTARWWIGIAPMAAIGAGLLLTRLRPDLVPATDGRAENIGASERPVGPGDLDVGGVVPNGIGAGVVEGRA